MQLQVIRNPNFLNIDLNLTVILQIELEKFRYHGNLFIYRIII